MREEEPCDAIDSFREHCESCFEKRGTGETRRVWQPETRSEYKSTNHAGHYIEAGSPKLVAGRYEF